MDNVKKVESKDLKKVSGGNSDSLTNNPALSGPGGIWNPKCPGCGKIMPGGEGVVRIEKEGSEHPYYCKDCAEKFIKDGSAKPYSKHKQCEKFVN